MCLVDCTQGADLFFILKHKESYKAKRGVIMKNNETSNRGGLKMFLVKNLFKIVIVVILVAAVIFGVTNYLKIGSDTTRIGFEDIGELATQSAYCTQVNEIDDYRKLFKINIPFTQSKYIYSYNVIIKAGYDFEEITWDENEAKKTITVKFPEAKILSTEVDFDSFKVYHEAESVFNNVTLKEKNEIDKKMIEKAEKNAIENGLLENAGKNAETIITGFFANVYDLDEYKIVFKHEKSKEDNTDKQKEKKQED